MNASFTVEQITGRLVTAPPVYDPGGSVCLVAELPTAYDAAALHALEQAAQERNAVLMVVPCPVNAAREMSLRAAGYAPSSTWYRGNIGQAAQHLVPEPMLIRAAITADVPRLLEIGEKKRRLYERFSPVFWRAAKTPRGEFAPYVTRQINAPENIALVAEARGRITGYCIAQTAKEPGGAYLDDFTVEEQADWPTAGAALLTAAAQRAIKRDFSSFVIVCGEADAPKRAAIESRSFSRYQNWWVKPLAEGV